MLLLGFYRLSFNNHSHNIDQFTDEHILREDTTWFLDCNWMFDKSKSVEQSVNYIINCIYHIHIKH